jgi:hypothetical protein
MDRPWTENTSHAATRVTGGAAHAATLPTVLFAAALLLGSALIFVVEPMFAKMVLPRAGGSPAVWNTCLVFFQAALLAGYGYAHLSTRWLRLRNQVALHLGLAVCAAMTLPASVPAEWVPPADSSPVPWLLGTLTLRLGPSFVVLASTAPLLQKWFAGTDLPTASDPYYLYAASNIGSLFALLAYPIVIEPTWTLGEQSLGWTVGYASFALVAAACALVALRRSRRIGVRADTQASATDTQAVTWLQRRQWLALSLVPSSLLLGVTTYLTTDIAAVPLLWTVPLALYLLTFVLAFAQRRWIPDRLTQRAAPLLITAVVAPAAIGGALHVLLIPLHLLAFCAIALSLHARLAMIRPATEHLTEFYLWIAAGGVAGGVLNTFLAPLVFTGVFEYIAGVVAACFLLPGDRDARILRLDVVLPVIVAAGAAAAALAARDELLQLRPYAALVGVLAIVSFSFSRRPVRFGLAVASLVLATHLVGTTDDRVLAADRTFFGVLRVRLDATTNRHILMHGSTMHGQQSLDAARQGEPLSYYHRLGPVGQMMTGLAGRLSDAHVGVVGLGAGSMAAYAQEGQRWTFYEIDPAVARIARDPSFFTYLRDCGSRCAIVLGDARLSLARTPARYDLLVLDAFSSDAIPVHLLTREALRLYLSRLSGNGLIAFHISNRHLQLRPVLAALAAEHGLASLVQLDPASSSPPAAGHAPSEWLLMARGVDDFGPLATDSRWQRPPAQTGRRVWTDDFSEILSVLKTEWR